MRIKNSMLKKLLCTAAIAAVIGTCFVPSVTAKATTTQTSSTTFAMPKDIAQSMAIETGVKVSWSKVNGAKQYLYSYSFDNKTYTTEALTGNSGTDNYIAIVNSTWKPGTVVYVKVRAFNGSTYTPYVIVKTATSLLPPAHFNQTDATTNTATLTWDACTGATGYIVKVGATKAQAKVFKKLTVSSTNPATSCTITGLEPDSTYYACVYPIITVTNNFDSFNTCSENYKVLTTGGIVSGQKVTDWNIKDNLVLMQWNNTVKNKNGYQIEVYSPNGDKLIKAYNISGRNSTAKAFVNKKIANTPFQYRMRSYLNMNGKKVYGAWSDFACAIPQADVVATKVSDTSVKLSWNKVTGAKSYTIYRATKDGGKYKKVATTKKKYYTVKGLSTNKNYYFYVKANEVKVGSVRKNSTKLNVKNDINVYISHFQDAVTY